MCPPKPPKVSVPATPAPPPPAPAPAPTAASTQGAPKSTRVKSKKSSPPSGTSGSTSTRAGATVDDLRVDLNLPNAAGSGLTVPTS